MTADAGNPIRPLHTPTRTRLLDSARKTEIRLKTRDIFRVPKKVALKVACPTIPFLPLVLPNIGRGGGGFHEYLHPQKVHKRLDTPIRPALQRAGTYYLSRLL